MSQHPIEGLMGVSMEKIREMLDVNTIVGEPISAGDVVIIPVSKVTVGFGSGGSDFPSKREKDLFGGGAGAGISLNPIAFLVVSDGNVTMLQISEEGGGFVGQAIDAVPGLIDKLSATFSKNKDKKESPEEK